VIPGPHSPVFSLLLALAAISLIIGCGESSPKLPSQQAERFKERIHSPGLNLSETGMLSLELAERCEDSKLYAEALQYYRQAAWAFEHDAFLTGRAHPLMEDARANLRRLEALAKTTR
jgi:hypothetical protein